MRRGRLVAVVVLGAALGLAVSMWVGEGPLWQAVMTKRVPVLDGDHLPVLFGKQHKSRGWKTVMRRSPSKLLGRGCLWCEATGFKIFDAFVRGSEIRMTGWDCGGNIRIQAWASEGDSGGSKLAPPWWWGKTNQAAPSDPQWLAEHGGENRKGQ